jgi:uncharacterized protein
MDQKEIILKLKRLRAELLKLTNFRKMFLFGSFANNEQKSDSDIDVAIVVNKIDGDYLKFMGKVWSLSEKYDTRIEPVVFLEGQPDHSGFYQHISKTGIEI